MPQSSTEKYERQKYRLQHDDKLRVSKNEQWRHWYNEQTPEDKDRYLKSKSEEKRERKKKIAAKNSEGVKIPNIGTSMRVLLSRFQVLQGDNQTSLGNETHDVISLFPENESSAHQEDAHDLHAPEVEQHLHAASASAAHPSQKYHDQSQLRYLRASPSTRHSSSASPLRKTYQGENLGLDYYGSTPKSLERRNPAYESSLEAQEDLSWHDDHPSEKGDAHHEGGRAVRSRKGNEKKRG
ncbi:MAG: hypothetical protein Q9162_005561 [Coniocarpon cinnabarinum]